MSGKVVIRIGASLKAALYVVRLPDDKILSVPQQSAATRFESFDAARETIALMLTRGDSWADRARPSRLVGTKTIRRSPTTEAAS